MPSGTATPLPSESLPPEERARELVGRMTLEEKIDYIGGDRADYLRGDERRGIPEINMSDGPAGCRNWGPSTAYPAPLSTAAAFDPSVAERVGKSIGRDCRARGVHILLAPGMNIHRSPLDGRNFEYLGEDPFLAGKTAAAFIRGVQSEGVLATAKHFAANNQEWDRNHISSEVDERTLREIYLPAFERSVREGHVSAVMTAYNLLNGVYCSHDPWLMREVLEKQWGFGGFVMSDWGAVHDAAGAVTGGMDLEMPSCAHLNRANLVPAIQDQKTLGVAAIDEKVFHILRTIAAAGFLDRPQKRDDVPLDDPNSAAAALDAARRGLVLLKNSGALLPLDRTKVKRIAVIGANGDPAVWGGYGSAFVTPFHSVSVLDGLKAAAPAIQIDHHPGVRQSSEYGLIGQPCFAGPVKEEVYSGKDLAGNPVATSTVDRIDYRSEGGPAQPPASGLPTENFSIRWTGEVAVAKAGRYQFMTNSDDGIRVFVDKKVIVEDWNDHPATYDAKSVDLQPGKHEVVVEYYQDGGGAIAQFAFAPDVGARLTLDGGAEVSALARQADVVIVSVGFGQAAETNSVRAPFDGRWPPAWARAGGLVEAEDSDRPFTLPPAQIETIRLAAAANPRTIVVVNAGGAVDLQPFVDRVPALLWAWYPGQEGGHAIADVLFGNVAPSGKLPVTFAKRYEDYPSAPYYNLNQAGKTPYTEGIFVGYRGFEAKKIAPQFPFGYGLSYTTFKYSDLEASPAADGSAAVTLKVTNAGKRDGEEIVEIYVAPPKAAVPRPSKELKGYARVSLAAGETKQVSVNLEPRAFAYWDDGKKAWSVEAGSYAILAAASSADVRGRTYVEETARSIAP